MEAENCCSTTTSSTFITLYYIWSDSEIQNESFDVAAVWKCFWNRSSLSDRLSRPETGRMRSTKKGMANTQPFPIRTWLLQRTNGIFVNRHCADYDNNVNQALNHILIFIVRVVALNMVYKHCIMPTQKAQNGYDI